MAVVYSNNTDQVGASKPGPYDLSDPDVLR
jgi:hypothetical protein